MSKTKKITLMGMFVAIAYVVMLICKTMPPMFAAFPFLSYDAKDVIIVTGGFILGPFAAFLISTAVSIIEMITVSDTNIIGCIMNIAASCAYACVASAVYMKMRSIKGAGFSLGLGVICCSATMIVLNYLLTPLYMKIPRETVAGLLIPAILPFNMLKAGFNSAITLIIYKPFVNILRRANLVEKRNSEENAYSNISVTVAGLFLIVVCTIAVSIFNS